MQIGTVIAIAMLLILFVFIPYRNEREAAQRVIRKKRKKGEKSMYEIVKSYLGKRCHLTMVMTELLGTVTLVEDGWMSITDEAGNATAVNLDYVKSIKECPDKKRKKDK